MTMTTPLPTAFDLLRARLLARAAHTLSLDGFAAAAVLVPVLVDPPHPERLLFTVRHNDLPTHAGQIAFPGGKRDPTDRDLVATALREAEEELGLPRERVEVIGPLDDVPTPTGFVITPVVALVLGAIELRPNRDEVIEFFSAELTGLADERCHLVEGTRHFLGVEYPMHTYRWGRHRIWGATARIVHQLLELLPRRSD
jgi:8-oxo-dGTP pyrophosphatase MutT (NUDIX family)